MHRKKTLLNVITVFASIVFAFNFFSCSEDKLPPTNIICLVDFSSSIDSNTFDWYRTVIKEDIVLNLGDGDKLLVLPVDFGSQVGSTEIFMAEINEDDLKKKFDSPTREKETIKRRLKTLIDTLAVTFDTSFNKAVVNRKKYEHQTDIIGAVQQADRYYLKDANNLILIFSDMVQESDKVNFIDEFETNKDIMKILDKLNIVKLNRFDVIVITGEQPEIQPERYKQMKIFWQAFFDKYGLNLIDYQSAGRNILIKQISEYKQQK